MPGFLDQLLNREIENVKGVDQKGTADTKIRILSSMIFINTINHAKVKSRKDKKETYLKTKPII